MNAELLRNLKPDGTHLEILLEEFSDMLEEGVFKVYSFQEALGFKGVNLLSRKVCKLRPWRNACHDMLNSP